MTKLSKKILICDDEEGIRESLKLILADNYNLIIAENGKQCLECLKNAPDVGLVLLDIKMPKLNGLDVLKEINRTRPEINTILITGYRSVETASEAAQHGVKGYIIKPFKSAEILETVREYLG
jgi:DNA-binding NtrC family response regulator